MCPDWNCWGVSALGEKLSKSLEVSQVPYLALNGFELELQHLTVCGLARGGHLGLRFGERQLEVGLASLARLLFCRERRLHRFGALRFFLLRFN